MIVDVIIDIFPKKEILNPETEAVKKTLSNLGYKNIEELVLSKQIKLSFKNLNEEEFNTIWNKIYWSYWREELTYTAVSDIHIPSLEESSY